MTMKYETLEILIGKYLDSEISPAEQRTLETELNNNPQAQDLLDQLQDLHEQARSAVASGVIEQAKTPDEIFELAWRRRSKSPFLRFAAAPGTWRFAAGLAAGFAIGLVLHFALISSLPPPTTHIEPKVAGQRTEPDRGLYTTLSPTLPPDSRRNLTRNIDWYGFTDKDGVRYLIEGYRENTVRPAVHYTGL